jgi:hypothetical protein
MTARDAVVMEYLSLNAIGAIHGAAINAVTPLKL